jgi:hypothetical protein
MGIFERRAFTVVQGSVLIRRRMEGRPLIIFSGRIEATSTSVGSGIGTGMACLSGWSTIENLAIFNGTVTPKSTIDSIAIVGGQITTVSSSFGSDLGAGRAMGGISTLCTLTIWDGTITAISHDWGLRSILDSALMAPRSS